MIRYLLLVLIAIVSFSVSHGFATIILLNGTASAGKSSIARILEREIKDAVFLSEESLWFDELNNFLEAKGLPCEANYCAVQRVIKNLEDKASINQILIDCFDRIYKKAGSIVSDLIKQGKHVIIDKACPSDGEVQVIKNFAPNAKFMNILVYCSPEKLLQHIVERNTSEDDAEHRSVLRSFSGYMKFYKPDEGPNGIDSIQKTGVCAIVSEAMRMAQGAGVSYHPFDQFDYGDNSDLLDKFLKHFMLDRNQYAVVAANVSYEIMVNTGILTAQECAEKILCTCNLF